jgi:hypothetical protein
VVGRGRILAFNGTSSNEAGGIASMPANTPRVRGFWAAYLALYAALFIMGVYPYLTLWGPPNPFQMAQTAVDLVVMYGLFGFVVQKPIRHIALRALFIIMVVVLCVRAVVVLYVVGPILFPWHGDKESFVSLTLLLGVPFQLLAVFALWQYASGLPRTSLG